MINVTNGISTFAYDVRGEVVGVAKEIQAGVLYMAEGGSRMLYDIYNLKEEGLEKWTKAIIVNLDVATRVFGLGNMLSGARSAFEAQKNIYYATKFVATPVEFTDLWNKRSTLTKWSKRCEAGVKITLGLGNIFEVGKFLQKHQVYPFETFSYLGTTLGNVKVSFMGYNRFEQLPLLGGVCSKPKEILIFISCILEIAKGVCEMYEENPDFRQWPAMMRRGCTWDNVLKYVCTIGKMILIGFSTTSFAGTALFLALDFVTQNSGYVRYVMKRDAARCERFEAPQQLPLAATAA